MPTNMATTFNIGGKCVDYMTRASGRAIVLASFSGTAVVTGAL